MTTQINLRRLGFTVSGIMMALSLLMVGCGGGFQPSADCADGCPSRNSDSANNGGTGGGPQQPGDPSMDEWNKVQFEGYVKGGTFDKTSVASLDKANKLLVVRLPLLPSAVPGGVVTGEVPIKTLPGASLTFEVQPDGRLAAVLKIPLEYVLRGVDFLPAARLPNGDPLPGIPDGEAPSLALTFPLNDRIRPYLYLDINVVALFVSTPFDPFLGLTFPIQNKEMTRTHGYFSLVPAKSGHNGGFYISVSLPDDLARILDEIL